jgi:hypothetical protein
VPLTHTQSALRAKMPIESAGEVLLLARNPRLYPFDPAYDKDRRKR